jgi:WD40 repeat protein
LHPFDETLIATADSSTIRFWRVPETGIKEQMTVPTSEIAGTSSRRISALQFHPTVNHLLNIIVKDGSVHFVDVERGADVQSVATGHTDTIQSLSWNWAVRLHRMPANDASDDLLTLRKSISGLAICYIR